MCLYWMCGGNPFFLPPPGLGFFGYGYGYGYGYGNGRLRFGWDGRRGFVANRWA